MSEFQPKSLSKKELAELWTFPWSIMDVLIGGRSSVDLPALDIQGLDDARAFLRSYGYDPDSASDQRRMHAVLVEAVYFIKTYLMPKEWEHGNRPPPEVLYAADPIPLLLWASQPRDHDRRRNAWACALLKLMHTITHIDGVQRLSNIHEARRQIMERFRTAQFRDGNGTLWFGDHKTCIELERLEWKHVKPRNSIILKLLHKPGNVAESIYDLLGVRIVTKRLSDAMLAVKFLRQFYLVDYPNTSPSRARNTLIDVDDFHQQVDTLRAMLLKGQISPRGFIEMLNDTHTPKRKGQSVNPHSSLSYRAIQLTCRQRVRYPNPALSWRDKLAGALADEQFSAEQRATLQALLDFVRQWHRTEESKEIAVFFPFEVQILDHDGAASIDRGDASHDRYKRSQLRTARRRILHEVLGLSSS